MEQNQVHIFTATQFARALGKTRQAVQQLLANVPPSGEKLVSGNSANAWSISALPVKLQNELSFEAAKKGYRNPESMLNTPPTIWQPAVRLSEVPTAQAEKAMKWRTALRETWKRREEDPNLSDSELERLGRPEFKAAFGYTISDRQWRAVFRRTIERDNGAEDWERLDIYLDENVKAAERKLEVSALEEFEELEAMMNRWPDRNNPSTALKVAFWSKVFEVYDERTSDSKSEKRVKRRLLDYLMEKAPFIAKTETGLRTNFGKKYQRWIEGGRIPSSVKDQRDDNSGYYRLPQVSAEVMNKELLNYIVFTAACGGRYAQGFQEWIPTAHPNIRAFWGASRKSKSQFPRRILELDFIVPQDKTIPEKYRGLSVKVKTAILLYMQNKDGGGFAKDGAFVTRIPSGYANDQHCSDDTTLPVYYYEEDAKGWYSLMRGQFLVTVDVRSLRVLGFVLISKQSYDSMAIHTLYTKVWNKYGIPKEVVHEGGIWNTARLLKGKRRKKDFEPLSGDEIEAGLSEYTKFTHVFSPRTKVVERVIGLLQNYMEREPGYCGRDEKNDRHDECQRLLLDFKAKRRSPVGIFYSAEQWVTRLNEIVETYNSTRQEGKYCQGLSPNEVYEKYQNLNDPPMLFPEECRYLLAARRVETVNRNGITINVGGRKFNYHNRHTARMLGQKVLTWFNPECPEILTVTDMNRKNPVCIPLSQGVPFIGADPELLRQETAKVRDHQGFGRALFRIVDAKFKQEFRKNIVDHKTLQLGREMAAQHDASKQESRLQEKNYRLSNKLRVPIQEDGSRVDETNETLRRYEAALAKMKKEAEKDL